MRTLGYLRVSTQEQKPDRQIDGLQSLCDRLYIEQASAGSRRPIYEKVMTRLKRGDTLVVWDLDRAFRSVVDAVLMAEHLKARGVHLRIVNLDVDTATPGGMLVYTVMSAFAEFERRMLSRRTREGLEAARRRGKQLGRPRKLTDRQLHTARKRLARGATLTAIAEDYGVAAWTLSRALRRAATEATRQ